MNEKEKFKHGHWYLVDGKRYLFVEGDFIFRYKDGKDFMEKECILISQPNDEYSETIYLDKAKVEEINE